MVFILSDRPIAALSVFSRLAEWITVPVAESHSSDAFEDKFVYSNKQRDGGHSSSDVQRGIASVNSIWKSQYRLLYGQYLCRYLNNFY